MMTPHGIQLLGRCRGLIALYPGVDSIQVNDGRTFTAVTVGAINDDAVFSLALLLGLGKVMERRAERPDGGARWYLAATAEQREGRSGALALLTVVGPAHIEAPGAPGPLED